jgi:hypothetical protein
MWACVLETGGLTALSLREGGLQSRDTLLGGGEGGGQGSGAAVLVSHVSLRLLAHAPLLRQLALRLVAGYAAKGMGGGGGLGVVQYESVIRVPLFAWCGCRHLCACCCAPRVKVAKRRSRNRAVIQGRKRGARLAIRKE